MDCFDSPMVFIRLLLLAYSVCSATISDKCPQLIFRGVEIERIGDLIVIFAVRYETIGIFCERQLVGIERKQS